MAVVPQNTTMNSRFLLLAFNRWFRANWTKFPQQYKQWNTMIGCDALTGTYDSMGNLADAITMADGADFDIGGMSQAYQTSITAVQIGKGWGITYKNQKAAANLSDLVPASKAYNVVKSMQNAIEILAITVWDNAFTVNLADGVPLCSNSHPCFDLVGGTGLVWDNLETGALSYATLQAGLQLFATFKDHQGKPAPSMADVIKTHAWNQAAVKIILESSFVPSTSASASAINPTPNLRPVFSNYLTSKTAWFVEDSSPDRPHGICQYLNGVPEPENKVEYNYLNRDYIVTSAYFIGCNAVPNIGLVGSTGL